MRKTIGDYLCEAEPVASLWPDLVDIVYRDNPRQANIQALTPTARKLFHAGCFEGEVINGGVSQFFSNSAGDRAHESLDALRAIGAVLSVNLLEKALTLSSKGIAPVDCRLRCELLFAFEEQHPQFLEVLTREFYTRILRMDAVPEENLTALQLAFMATHRTELIEHA